ncbi:MAG: cytochrome c3 family protein [Planctomycetes bacterium]|nr:cytochrome c3 family protein [Planctomycetota bacterium]
MKKTILMAGAMALIVLAVFVGLILTTGKDVTSATSKPNGEAASETQLVPPVERITEEGKKDASDKGKVAYHTKAEPPKVKIFQTLYKGGTQIVFNHEKHAKDLGLACIECHHVERCSKCHLKNGSHSMEVVNAKQALHENCIGCHSEVGAPEKCMHCHKQ